MFTQKLLSIALLSTEWIIGLLIVLSVLSIAIIIERFIVFAIKGNTGKDFEPRLRAAMRGGRARDAVDLLSKSKSSTAKVILRVSEEMTDASLPFEEALSIAISEEKLELERRIAILGTLGSNAPYVGLLGTVLGIIHAFHNLSLHIQGGPSVILKGISEALVATALGLFIAIPAVAAYNYFVRAIKKLLVNAENTARSLVPVLSK